MDTKRSRASETMIFTPRESPITSGDKEGFLTVIRSSGVDLGKSQQVKGSLDIGRSKSCGLELVDMQVSSRHARVLHDQDGAYRLEDLGSTNGTRLNHRVVTGPVELVEGDKIFVGQTVIRFFMADAMDLSFHSELSQMVHTDELTGLEAKRCFDDALEIAFAQAHRSREEFSLLMIDMDGLKAINDTHGHLFGAYVIGETGRLIGKVLGSRGRACRFGGDEFMVMLPGVDKPVAAGVAEELRSALEHAGLTMEGVALRPTLSVGVGSYPEDGASIERLIDAADRAMYRAKRSGKNRVCC